MRPSRNPEAALYRRNASRLTTVPVVHATEKAEQVAALPLLRRRSGRAELVAAWAADEQRAGAQAGQVLAILRGSVAGLVPPLEALVAAQVPELLGKAEAELKHAQGAVAHYDEAEAALARLDFGAAGAAVEQAAHELGLSGRGFTVALNTALEACAVRADAMAALEENVAERRQAKLQHDTARAGGDLVAAAEGEAKQRRLQAAGFALAAELLGSQVRPKRGAGERRAVGRDNAIRVLSPGECETFDDIGGLAEVKEQIRQTVGTILERPDEAARYQVVHNGLLFYGPPGTGKNLLSRALAGEYGLRYVRFSPSAIASAYLHEAAANLRHLFELAKENAPCVLYLDEIDTIASNRGDQPSADHREVVTQLMVCLEEYRSVPGLVIAAATNDLDRLDPALREGRFDAKILVPLPDADDRADVLTVHLRRRGDAVEWDGLDLAALARDTAGYNAAALETVVSLAAQAALRDAAPIDQARISAAVASRGGQHRLTIEQQVGWDDVVLDDETRDRVMEILTIFAQPDLARQVGVRPPAGVLLYGPPGTGKTTIAKAMASQSSASFYEMSAADLLSKWAGESEQRVAKLFAQARANRPSIVFIDEIDALLRRRSGDSNAKWEERVLSQFLRELDGLTGGEGVLLVGATNRIDTIDEAIVGRRLEPVEIGLPDAAGRLKLLQLLCRDVQLAKSVNLRSLLPRTEGMSGAELQRLRDTAGRKALGRATQSGKAPKGGISLTMADFEVALRAQRSSASLATV
ncbi:MAG: transitional endoplasmic reticulum ATPase [Frankiaceae bacterium]|jgi:SpoVK/Ycf46/Vps4 family AAA+-type ATPase|nr:transitional endoplasmic reticulum ATPase [Frankiaceae bacterium]